MKIRIAGAVQQNRCIYSTIAVNLEGKKEKLEPRSAETVGAKFRRSVLTDAARRLERFNNQCIGLSSAGASG